MTRDDKGALKWLSNYLTGRSQYVVIEATDGRKYEMPVGTPQGGALGQACGENTQMTCLRAAKGQIQGRARMVRMVKTGETQWKPIQKPVGNLEKKTDRVKSEGKLGLGLGNLKRKLRTMEGAREVDAGET